MTQLPRRCKLLVETFCSHRGKLGVEWSFVRKTTIAQADQLTSERGVSQLSWNGIVWI